MNKQQLTNKERPSRLYGLELVRIGECEKFKKEIISFPRIFEKLCRGFSIKKKEAWSVLYELRDFGLITIVPFHGVKLNG